MFIIIKDDFKDFNPLIEKLDLYKEIDKSIIVKLKYKKDLKIAYKLYFNKRLKEDLKFFKK